MLLSRRERSIGTLRQDARNQGHSEYRWRKVRKEHLQDESCCQMCEVLKELEVHHIVPWHLCVELRFTRSNLITLCRDCHYRFGHCT